MKQCKKVYFGDAEMCATKQGFNKDWCNDCWLGYTKEEFEREQMLKAKTQDIHVIQDFHEPYFDHGLGQVIHSRQERRAVMKSRGLEEVGNEWNAIDPVKVARQREREDAKQYEAMKRQAIAMMEASQWN